MRGPGGTALPALGGRGWDLFFLEGKMPLPLFGSHKPCLQAPSRGPPGAWDACCGQDVPLLWTPGCLPGSVSELLGGGGSGDAKTGVKALTFLRASLLGGHKSLLLMPLPQALPRSLVQVWGDGDH